MDPVIAHLNGYHFSWCFAEVGCEQQEIGEIDAVLKIDITLRVASGVLSKVI